MAINPNPFLRVLQWWFVQEPASTFFSLVIALIFAYYYAVFREHTRQSMPAIVGDDVRVLHATTTAVFIMWILAYAASVAFHTHETVLTERLDYFCPVLATMTQFVWGMTVVSSSVREHAWLFLPLMVLPLALFALYFMYTMHFVKFDYGWQNRVVLTLLVADALLFAPWVLLNVRKKSFAWYIVLGNLAIVLAAPFEIVDFRPVWRTFDGHSLWHAGGAFVAFFFCSFMVRQFDDALATRHRRSMFD